MSVIEEAKRVLRIEAQAIIDLIDRLGSDFEVATETLLACKGKVIVTGMGKSGQVARKLASTLSSTGTPALFLHPAESAHGDLGVISSGDAVIALSYGGENDEMLPLLQYIERKSIPLIALTGQTDSRLAKVAKAVLSIQVKEEACPLKLAPTSSSTAAMAMADALAMGLLKEKGFSREDFAEFHPSGTLGRRLLTRIKDIMHSGSALPLVSEDTPMTEVLSIMTGKEVRGVAGVVDKQGSLVGIVTDGDVRRSLEKSNKAFTEKASEVMSRSPKTIDQEELAEKALFVMEQFQITRLFVISKASGQPLEPVGLIDFSDLLRANIR